MSSLRPSSQSRCCSRVWMEITKSIWWSCQTQIWLKCYNATRRVKRRKRAENTSWNVGRFIIKYLLWAVSYCSGPPQPPPHHPLTIPLPFKSKITIWTLDWQIRWGGVPQDSVACRRTWSPRGSDTAGWARWWCLSSASPELPGCPEVRQGLHEHQHLQRRPGRSSSLIQRQSIILLTQQRPEHTSTNNQWPRGCKGPSL